MFHNSKTTRLVYPLALRTNNVHLQPSKYRPLFHNSKRTRSVYPSALPLQPKAGFIPVNLSTSNSTCRNLQIYLQNFNWLLQRQETTRKSKENSSANAVKWRQSAKRLSGRFRTGSPHPLRTFATDQCIPASAI